METIPECELGNKLEQHEGNRKFLSKFGLDALKVNFVHRNIEFELKPFKI